MTALLNRLKSITKIQFLALALIAGGLGLMIYRGIGLWDFSLEARFAMVHNFQAGNPSPELLRPWMTIRYISSAYGVPQKYLFDAAKIQPRRETSLLALNRLNRDLKLGEVDGKPALIKTMRDAIVQYRIRPVVTGLVEQRVEDWMTIQYIANSTGIPEETLAQAAGISLTGNGYLPLGYLSDQIHYAGGVNALIAALQKVVDTAPHPAPP